MATNPFDLPREESTAAVARRDDDDDAQDDLQMLGAILGQGSPVRVPNKEEVVLAEEKIIDVDELLVSRRTALEASTVREQLNNRSSPVHRNALKRLFRQSVRNKAASQARDVPGALEAIQDLADEEEFVEPIDAFVNNNGSKNYKNNNDDINELVPAKADEVVVQENPSKAQVVQKQQEEQERGEEEEDEKPSPKKRHSDASEASDGSKKAKTGDEN